jgi:uncharacterized protein YjdB
MKKFFTYSMFFFVVFIALIFASLPKGFAALNFYEVELNNSTGTADVITADYSDRTNVYGQINNNHYDIDYYRFNLTAKTRVKIYGYWTGTHNGKGWEDDLLIGVLNSAGTLTHVAEYTKINTSYYSYLDVTLNAGTYYMVVMQNDEYPTLYINQPYTAMMQFNYIQTAVAATGISIDKSSISLIGLGTSEKLIATVEPTNATNKNVTWKSSDTSVASVSSNGTVTAVGAGQAIITATSVSGGFTATTSVSVVIPIASITTDRNNLELIGRNHTIKLTPSILPLNATNQVLRWESDNPSAATVSNDGTITSVNGGVGHIVISSTDGSNIILRIPFKVTIPISKIEYLETKQKISLVGLNEEHALTYVLEPENATNKNLKWISSDPSVVSVDNAGVLTSLSYGEAVVTIMSTDGTNLQDTIIVSVNYNIPWFLIIGGIIGVVGLGFYFLKFKSKKIKINSVHTSSSESESMA